MSEFFDRTSAEDWVEEARSVLAEGGEALWQQIVSRGNGFLLARQMATRIVILAEALVAASSTATTEEPE